MNCILMIYCALVCLGQLVAANPDYDGISYNGPMQQYDEQFFTPHVSYSYQTSPPDYHFFDQHQELTPHMKTQEFTHSLPVDGYSNDKSSIYHHEILSSNDRYFEPPGVEIMPGYTMDSRYGSEVLTRSDMMSEHDHPSVAKSNFMTTFKGKFKHPMHNKSDVDTEPMMKNEANNMLKHGKEEGMFKHGIEENMFMHGKEESMFKHERDEGMFKHGKEESMFKHGIEETMFKHGKDESIFKHGKDESMLKHGNGGSMLKYGKEESMLKHGKEESMLKHGKEESMLKHGKEESVLKYGKEESMPKNGKESHTNHLETKSLGRNTKVTHKEICKNDTLVPRCYKGSTRSWCFTDEEYPVKELEQIAEYHKAAVFSAYADVTDLNKHNSVISTKDMGAEKYLCPSETLYAKPLRAVNTKGKWRVIVNNIRIGYELLTQTARIEECLETAQPCALVPHCQSSRCLQKSYYHNLLVYDPCDKNFPFAIETFRLPSSCSCHLGKSYMMH